jgi:hypothetical protein
MNAFAKRWRLLNSRSLARPSANKIAADRFAANVLPVIRQIQKTGATSNQAIAVQLNERGIKTARGGRWAHVQVGAILGRA